MAMAMTSPSVAHPGWKFDVFLSFRGEDTRDNFTSHLYDALCCKNVSTFIDNELERGEEITPVLLRTIEESRISVVIFSINYPSSPWCMDELVKILECKKTYGQIVLPIFYHVDPSDVFEQRGGFGHAFAGLEKGFKGKMDKVPRWITLLRNAASISGWDSQVTRPESKLVTEVVQTILKILHHDSSSDLRGLVGIDSHIEEINELLLSIRPSDVCTIGIWGMGGIGKTTIAEAFFYSISSQYESHHFLPKIREQSEKGRLVHLRDELLSKLSGEQNLYIGTPRIRPTFIRDRICRKKVLLVLDDVNDVDQFEVLTGGRDLFGAGSIIVVTSRDKQVLKNVVTEIYEVEELNFHEALQLFSLNAFKENHPPKEYKKLSISAINYTKGNPLALKVLGSFLFGRDKHIWESALNRLESIPTVKIYDVLKAGLDALPHDVKDVFLDIACFFKGQQVNFVKGILDGCGFPTNTGFSILVDRCLIKISNDMVEMHDLLQEFAHEIVRQESIKELGERSRLWSPGDVYQVLTKNMGTGKVEGIFVDISKIREMELSSTAFARMYNLRLLKIYNSGVGKSCKVHLPHGLESLSNELRYLHWDGYPLTSLPSYFCPDNLVELNISSSKIKRLWEGNQNLVNLKNVNLGYCKHLSSIPDLSKAKNLERLNLQFCSSLVKVPSSIQHLDKLIDLDLRHCTSLVSLPDRIASRHLKTVNFLGCSKLKKFPEIPGNVTYLNLNETAIEELSQSFVGDVNRLVALNLKDCKNLGNLPDNLCLLKSLVIVDLSGCSNISRFPDISRGIKYLYLGGTEIEELPSSIGRLWGLISLDLTDCKRLKNLPSAISKLGSLEKLNLSGCSSITKFPEVSRIMKYLYLDGTAIREIPFSIECCSELVELHLKNCTRFEILPSSICKLKALQSLVLSGCSQFGSFPEILEPMEHLRYLYLDRTGVRKLPSPTKNLMGISSLRVGDYFPLTETFREFQFPKDMDLSCLRMLDLKQCGICQVPASIGDLFSLEVLDLSGNDFETLPASIIELFQLQYLGLRYCWGLVELPELPARLTKLDADSCELLETVSSSSNADQGTIFEFLFTNCLCLCDSGTGSNQIMAYFLMKIRLYMKKLYDQMSDVSVGTSSICFPGLATPEWFSHQTWGSKVKVQLPPHWVNSEFLGFTLCAVIEFDPESFSQGFQVKCIYHFHSKSGDSHDPHCYLHGWYDKKHIESNHLFLGFDPCLVAFNKYNEVSIEFYPEDIDGDPLLDCCQVTECGVRLLYVTDEIQHTDFVAPHLETLDSCIMEAPCKAKRSRDGSESERIPLEEIKRTRNG